jgi:hypothetical protein
VLLQDLVKHFHPVRHELARLEDFAFLVYGRARRKHVAVVLRPAQRVGDFHGRKRSLARIGAVQLIDQGQNRFLIETRTRFHEPIRPARGHSYGGYSTSRGLIISVARMNGVRVSGESMRITLGPGARNRDLYATAGRDAAAALTALLDLRLPIIHGICAEPDPHGVLDSSPPRLYRYTNIIE